jgi:hypothetical protein
MEPAWKWHFRVKLGKEKMQKKGDPSMQQQTGGQTGQQPVMMTPPSVITSKDCLYLKDQLSWTLLAMKKCAHYAQECTDPQVRDAINQAGQMHQRHFSLLLKHLQTPNAQAAASGTQFSFQQ